MITYCTNIHPGESWEEIHANVRKYIPGIKTKTFPDRAFPIGLRISNRASLELNDYRVAEFRDWCIAQNCFIPTINGFPYGTFHGPRVKEAVYAPDWRCRPRAEYTIRLATVLAEWLPYGVSGSVSTVPVCFGKNLSGSGFSAVRQNILHAVERVDRIRQKTGKEVVIALEPEPGCFLETTRDVLRFFDRLGLPPDLQSCLGICYDCCHHAVQFEEPVSGVLLLRQAGIRIAIVHVSSALRLNTFDRSFLARVAEPVYLHQVAVRDPDGVKCYKDIPEALALCDADPERECRVHFHIPVFLTENETFGTTQAFIREVLPLFGSDILLEIETYTWHVLPAGIPMQEIQESIVGEIKWLESAFNETNSRT